MDPRLPEIALAALESNSFQRLELELQSQTYPDSFSLLRDPAISEILSKELGANLAEWITRSRTWDVESYDPSVTFSPSENLLHVLWQWLAGRLRLKLDAMTKVVPLAPKGAILTFFSGTNLSVIVRYERLQNGGLDLRPIAVRERAQGIFDLVNLLADGTPQQRNLIKAAASTVDKIVFQRGVLVHVDRQRDDVFGPSVDTVVLAELLARWLEERKNHTNFSALEVGPGSGLLSCLIASSDELGTLYSIDLATAAVRCTLKNLEINGVQFTANAPTIRVRAEAFSPEEFPTQIDLIVCNPPYLPDPPDADELERTNYDLATSGPILNALILGSLDKLLLPHGELLLMTSSASIEYVRKLIPDGFIACEVFPERGLRVPLDIDSLWNNPEWQKALKSAGYIEIDDDGSMWHYLQPLWIRRTAR